MTESLARKWITFETPMPVPQFSFLLASAHHLPSMNHSYIFLLLLVVLSAHFESPQYAKPPTIEVTVYPNSSFAQLGILAPVLPHNEAYKTPPPHIEVSKTIPPHIEVYKTILLHIEVSKNTMPQNEVYKIALPQNMAELSKTVLPQTEVFKIDAANCLLSDSVKMIMKFLLNLKVKSLNNLNSALIHGGENLVWTENFARIPSACFENVYLVSV